MSNSPHVRKIRELAQNLEAIPANEQCIGHFQVAMKNVLLEVADELERLAKILGVSQ